MAVPPLMDLEDLERLRSIADSLASGAMRLRQELDYGGHPEKIRTGARSTGRYCIELADLLRLYYPDPENG